MSSYFYITLRKTKNGQFVDEIDLAAPRYLEVPVGQLPDPNAYGLKLSEWTGNIIDSFTKNSDGQPSGDIAFFVHGFNNTVQEVATRQQLIHEGLNNAGFSCQSIAFDWPSNNKVFAYSDDLDHAKTSALVLVKAALLPFVKALRTDCDINVHVLGHSMGAFLIREAFDHADDDNAVSSKKWAANQLVLFAGDVSARKFAASNSETESMYRHCYRLTNYFSRYDEALQVSNAKRLGVEPRVGRVGLPTDVPEKAVNVDCSDYFDRVYRTDLTSDLDPVLTHSWYFNDSQFMKDLASTLQGSVDREKIATRTPPGPDRVQMLR